MIRIVGCATTAAISLHETIGGHSGKGSRSVSILWVLMLIPLWACGQSKGLFSMSADSLGYWIPSRSTVGHIYQGEHPVEMLSSYYQHRLESLLSRQSKTYTAAMLEYQRRYNRAPPPGFQDWFTYAQKHNSLLIDDFDSIEESIQALRLEEPTKIRELIDSAADAPGSSMLSCSTHDGKFSDTGCEWMGAEISELLFDIDPNVPLPDVKIALNNWDEPRVLPNLLHHDNVTWIDRSRHSIWDLLTEHCQSQHSSKQHGNSTDLRSGLFTLPFVHDAVEAKDLCAHPEYPGLHGFFQNPSTFLYTQATVPVLSPAKPSPFADILYPPPYYMEMYDQNKYDEATDPPWDEKRGELYWAGSTTGSHAADDNWRNSHRQRFVARENQLSNQTANFLTEIATNRWQSFSSDEIFGQLYDVKFTAVIQCDDNECAEESSFFNTTSREDANAGLHSKFVFDLDGNSFSGRFYTLLASKSVVFKQTIFQEWHDERLIPWVHYVPVSLDMEELPELMRYLALTKRGDARAKAIADEGRDWAKKALRKEDASVYMYRLFLELGRLLEIGVN